jgi:hypothetical protein
MSPPVPTKLSAQQSFQHPAPIRHLRSLIADMLQARHDLQACVRTRWAQFAIQTLSISEGNSGSVASPRMHRMCSSWLGIGSCGPFQLPALPTEAFEIRISRFYCVATLLAYEPAFRSRQHWPELIAQDAVRATYDLLSHWTLFLMPTAQYLTSAWPRPW